MKKIVETGFGKCPYGNWFLGNVFWDWSILIKSVFGKCHSGKRIRGMTKPFRYPVT